MTAKPSFFINIDVVGVCNLKCPSCPSGNWQGERMPNGIMSVDLFERIMAKASAELNITGVGLFNWNEPILHPELPQLIKIVRKYGAEPHISSNLNVLKDPDGVMEANPSSFRISASGYRQEVYQRTHRGGDIEKVKRNMARLAEAKSKTGSTTPVHVLYHIYLHNIEDAVAMKSFANQLGFEFQGVWAFMMPMEKILAATGDTRFAKLTYEDRELIDSLALPLDRALEVSQQMKHMPCGLREQQMTIDYRGDVWLCCGVFDAKQSILGSYMDLDWQTIQSKKSVHPSCGPCMDKGIHVYGTYGTEKLNQIGVETVMENTIGSLSQAMNMQISFT